MTINIAVISTSDNAGGAARAAFRLHIGLLKKGIDSNMLVQRKDTDNSRVIDIQSKIQ